MGPRGGATVTVTPYRYHPPHQTLPHQLQHPPPTLSLPGEGREGDLQTLWSSARYSLVLVQARCHRPITTTQCRTCRRAEETLAHVLNHCHYNLGMARERHNAILERVVRAVPDFLGTKTKEQPLPRTTGDNRPDLTIISPCGTKVTLVEVSCPFEGSPTALEDAAAHKVQKYEPLQQQLLQQYREVTVHPFIVGSLGSWFPGNDRVLSALRIGHKYAALMRCLCVVSAIAGSQNLWYQAMCQSHRRPPPPPHNNQPSTMAPPVTLEGRPTTHTRNCRRPRPPLPLYLQHPGKVPRSKTTQEQ